MICGQLQSNTKDDYVTIHKRSLKAGPKDTANKSLYRIESILQVVLKEPQQHGINSNHASSPASS